MLTRLLLLLLLSSATISTFAEVRIRLFYAYNTETVLVRIPDSTYSLQYNNSVVDPLETGALLLITRAGDRVSVSQLSGFSLIVDSLRILSSSEDSFLSLSLPGTKREAIEYCGDFTFSSSLGVIKIINNIALESYIAGVVQAEGGYKGHPEYFRTQAVIARTYAYLHLDRHANEHYDLCDDVHCQVYHGRSVTGVINDAVIATRGIVITDSDSLLILTPFHSNCGGQTATSGDVWLTDLPYLESIIDPYCGFSRNALWEKNISRGEWLNYLKAQNMDIINPGPELNFVQNARLQEYKYNGSGISLRKIRDDFGLRSTFFSIKDEGETLKLSGRGYGHGVGLCQEGAMVMAKRGFKYLQIINFYYKGVKIMDMKSVKIPAQIELSF